MNIILEQTVLNFLTKADISSFIYVYCNPCVFSGVVEFCRLELSVMSKRAFLYPISNQMSII